MDDQLIATFTFTWGLFALGASFQYFARGLVRRIKKRGRK